jgi:hypothetical protein
MRTRSALGLTAAMILAAACAHPAPEAPAPMSWSFNQTQAEGLKLVYGQPRSDNVLLMLSCQPLSGQVEVAVATSDEAAGAVGLVSRQARFDLSGPAAPTPLEGVGLVMETAAISNPALENFAQTGELSVRTTGKSVPAEARGADQALVAGFFSQCGQAV